MPCIEGIIYNNKIKIIINNKNKSKKFVVAGFKRFLTAGNDIHLANRNKSFDKVCCH